MKRALTAIEALVVIQVLLVAVCLDGAAVILAVTLDKSWDGFRGRQSLKHLVFANSAAEIKETYDVRGFSVTFVVDAMGRFRLRFDDSHDWRSQSVSRSIANFTR
ncbi:MAG: hypothetical protein ABI333_08805 [bacterium]